MPEAIDIAALLARIPLLAELRAALAAAPRPLWLVGGSVRDLLLDRVPVDIDLTAEEPEPLARRFAEVIGGRVVPMDPARGIWRVTVGPEKYFDFCRFRDHDITGDLRGRDFTINAIALRLPEDGRPGELVDPWHGVENLRGGVLRLVDERAFRDDPARILRAFRFFAELPLAIEAETWDALRADAERLPLVAPERLLAEWWKLCAGVRAAESIRLMADAGVLVQLFPELRPEIGCMQNAFHRWDVWEHALHAVEMMAGFLDTPKAYLPPEIYEDFSNLLHTPHRRARLLFLALIHDMGKPATRNEVDGAVHFIGHDLAGAEMAAALGERLRLSREDTHALTTVIRHHLRPLHLLQRGTPDDISAKSLIKFFDDTGDFALEVLALALADLSASQGPATETDVVARLLELIRALLTFYRERYRPALAHPLLTGNDLLRHLHLPAGPAFGWLLRRARDLQIRGDLTTREAALSWAETHAKDQSPQQ